MSWNNIYKQNIVSVLTSPLSLLRWIIAWCLVGVIWWCFMDIDLIIWNQGHIVAYTEIVLFLLFVILFAFFVALSIHKILYFQATDKKQISLWSAWWVLSMVVIWCPACSITLASYIWLASLLSLLPFKWLELKVLWIILLVYVIIKSLKSLHVCSLKQKKTAIDRNVYIRMCWYIIWFLVCLWAVVDYWIKQNWFTL